MRYVILEGGSPLTLRFVTIGGEGIEKSQFQRYVIYGRSLKGDTPLVTYHLDQLGPTDTTEKRYRFDFCCGGCVQQIHLNFLHQNDEFIQSDSTVIVSTE